MIKSSLTGFCNITTYLLCLCHGTCTLSSIEAEDRLCKVLSQKENQMQHMKLQHSSYTTQSKHILWSFLCFWVHYLKIGCVFFLYNKDNNRLFSQKASLVNQKTMIVIQKVQVTLYLFDMVKIFYVVFDTAKTAENHKN